MNAFNWVDDAEIGCSHLVFLGYSFDILPNQSVDADGAGTTTTYRALHKDPLHSRFLVITRDAPTLAAAKEAVQTWLITTVCEALPSGRSFSPVHPANPVVSQLREAAQKVVAEGLASVEGEVHVCDRNDPHIKSQHLPESLRELYEAVKAFDLAEKQPVPTPGPAGQGFTKTQRNEIEAAIRSLRYAAHPQRSPHADDLEAMLNGDPRFN